MIAYATFGTLWALGLVLSGVMTGDYLMTSIGVLLGAAMTTRLMRELGS